MCCVAESWGQHVCTPETYKCICLCLTSSCSPGLNIHPIFSTVPVWWPSLCFQIQSSKQCLYLLRESLKEKVMLCKYRSFKTSVWWKMSSSSSSSIVNNSAQTWLYIFIWYKGHGPMHIHSAGFMLHWQMGIHVKFTNGHFWKSEHLQQTLHNSVIYSIYYKKITLSLRMFKLFQLKSGIYFDLTAVKYEHTTMK